MDVLDHIEVRVLGALTEKSLATPDYYPLSLNALTLACNQSSNREPVMQLSETDVIAATDRLRRKSLVRALQKADSRVMKYHHLLAETLELDAREQAVLCVLMLRGPQTLSELKTRTARLAEFASVEAVEQTVAALMTRAAAPLAVRLARRAGQKELRYAHLLAGDVSVDAHDGVATPSVVGGDPDRITALEQAIAELNRELSDVKLQLNEFRKQFE